MLFSDGGSLSAGIRSAWKLIPLLKIGNKGITTHKIAIKMVI
jgi:hypothetical protein